MACTSRARDSASSRRPSSAARNDRKDRVATRTNRWPPSVRKRASSSDFRARGASPERYRLEPSANRTSAAHGEPSLVRDALGESQEPLALLAPATEGADPRPHQGERSVAGYRFFGQRREPTFHGRGLAGDHVSVPVARDQQPHAPKIICCDGLTDSPLEKAGLLQPHARPRTQDGLQ